MQEMKEKIRARLVAEIDDLEQEIIRLNKVACEQNANLTPDEFVKLPAVIQKETLMKKLDEKHELLHKFFPPKQEPTENKEEPLY